MALHKQQEQEVDNEILHAQQVHKEVRQEYERLDEELQQNQRKITEKNNQI